MENKVTYESKEKDIMPSLMGQKQIGTKFLKKYETSDLDPQKEIVKSNDNLELGVDYVIDEYPNGERYEGEKENGKRQGKGKYFYTDGSYYEGE